MNSYSIEPNLYPSEDPSPQQSRRSVFLKTGTVLFIGLLLSIALAVS